MKNVIITFRLGNVLYNSLNTKEHKKAFEINRSIGDTFFYVVNQERLNVDCKKYKKLFRTNVDNVKVNDNGHKRKNIIQK